MAAGIHIQILVQHFTRHGEERRDSHIAWGKGGAKQREIHGQNNWGWGHSSPRFTLTPVAVLGHEGTASAATEAEAPGQSQHQCSVASRHIPLHRRKNTQAHKNNGDDSHFRIWTEFDEFQPKVNNAPRAVLENVSLIRPNTNTKEERKQ